MAHLITGYAGEEHIQSKDQGSFNAAFFGKGQYVMQIGSELEASITSNNNVRIFDGDLLMYGRHVRIEPDTYEDVLIETGTAGMNRNDLIVMRYEKNSSTGIETAKVEVIRGGETEETPVDPTYIDGDILEGAIINQMPLYRVVMEGVVLLELVPLFEKIPTYAMLAEQYKEEFRETCVSHLDSLNIFDTLEEVNANTESNQLAGALAVRELDQKLAEAGTVRYDPVSDYVQIIDATGVWHNWKMGRILWNLYIFQNGTGAILPIEIIEDSGSTVNILISDYIRLEARNH